jgi:hypothetical protein
MAMDSDDRVKQATFATEAWRRRDTLERAVRLRSQNKVERTKLSPCHPCETPKFGLSKYCALHISV